MAARKNGGGGKTSGYLVSIRPNRQVVSELDRLTQMGLFGNSRAEVAEELMRAQLRQLHREGWFPDITRKSRKNASGGAGDDTGSRNRG